MPTEILLVKESGWATLDKPTHSAVKHEIHDALKQSKRVIIDGRAAGLTAEEATRGVARAAGVGKVPDELIIILKDGSILPWP